MTEKLKPCPFCGDTAEFDDWKTCHNSILFCVRCINDYCDVKPHTDWFNTTEQAVKAWNRRADND